MSLELDYFLKETLHSQYCSCTKNYSSTLHESFKNASDICEVVQNHLAFKNLQTIADAIDFNDLEKSLRSIFFKLAENPDDLNYAKLWLLLSLFRYIIIQRTLKGFDSILFDKIIKDITSFSVTFLCNYIKKEGSLKNISLKTVSKSFDSFLSKDLDLLIKPITSM